MFVFNFITFMIFYLIHIYKRILTFSLFLKFMKTFSPNKIAWFSLLKCYTIMEKNCTIHTPSVFSPFFNEKTLDYPVDNQAFVGFAPLSILKMQRLFFTNKLSFSSKIKQNTRFHPKKPISLNWIRQFQTIIYTQLPTIMFG